MLNDQYLYRCCAMHKTCMPYSLTCSEYHMSIMENLKQRCCLIPRIVKKLRLRKVSKSLQPMPINHTPLVMTIASTPHPFYGPTTLHLSNRPWTVEFLLIWKLGIWILENPTTFISTRGMATFLWIFRRFYLLGFIRMELLYVCLFWEWGGHKFCRKQLKSSLRSG